MAETGLIIERPKDEFLQIMEHIANGDNFLLSGGAGSGKTYSLVQVIRQVIADNPISKVACMTYTNAAVKEIEERVNHKNLNVSTIHDFLWDNIKHFQKELKLAIVALVNDENVTKVRIDDLDNISNDFFDNREEPVKIQYKEYLRLKDGIISHDELLVIADYMFEHYPKLCDIVKDKYRFIFIDEYQDTHREVVRILLEHFAKNEKHSTIGFFGDAMQSIYDNGIGNINEYKGKGKVKEVKKAQNRRNPQKIISLANRLRTDEITQVPSTDDFAPNMADGQVKEGKIMFIHSTNEDISRVKQFLSEHHGWNFSDAKETKELNLTHNLIADKAGFRTLMDIYDKDYILDFKKRIKDYIKSNGVTTDFSANTFGEVVAISQRGKTGRDLNAVSPTPTMQRFIDNNPNLYQTALDYNYAKFSKIYVDKDQLIDDKKQDEDDENKKGSKRDNLIRHLFKIQTNITLYINGQYNEFLRITDYKQINSIEDKRTLRKNIESLVNVGDKTIEEVINDAHEKGICLIDEKLEKFREEKIYIYNQVKNVNYNEFQELFKYLEGQTPFSTQHKTKGTEFNNVLVILDNGKWNDYNFEYLFTNRIDKQSVLERTQKIFYVCCTRAKENLVVFYHNPSLNVISQAKLWFEEENVHSID
ncbi:MAG: AAA family ATPase [Prevotellaceae bacterium]|jgi:DNA helicase-2/ATP-dependent DNA helicase PcrA|nr:AAA family ATPase [Prevotellaceae bacterium]